jgi:DNA-directed RNA polymerase subunit F
LTTDIDLAVVVDEKGYARIVSALDELGYGIAQATRVEPTDPIPAVTVFRNEANDPPYRQVDILAAATQFEREAVRCAVERIVAERTVPVVTREHLIVYKLLSWRPRDQQDITDVLATARAAGTRLDIDLMRRWAAVWEVDDRLEVVLSEP